MIVNVTMVTIAGMTPPEAEPPLLKTNCLVHCTSVVMSPSIR